MSNGVVELLFLLAFFAPPLAVVIGALWLYVGVLLRGGSQRAAVSSPRSSVTSRDLETVR